MDELLLDSPQDTTSDDEDTVQPEIIQLGPIITIPAFLFADNDTEDKDININNSCQQNSDTNETNDEEFDEINHDDHNVGNNGIFEISTDGYSSDESFDE